MAPRRHEIFQRHRGRNLGLLAVLLAVVALIYGVTIVKLREGHPMEGFDHSFRPSMLPPTEE